jgi:hypothetical protein
VQSKEFDQGINCVGKLVCWVARFSYLLVLKRRFSNLLYLDLELFSIFGERNRILRVGSVHKRIVIKNSPNFFRFLIFLSSSRIKAFECAFLVWKVVQERPWVFASSTVFKILRQEDGVCCLVIFIRVEIQWPSKQVGEEFFELFWCYVHDFELHRSWRLPSQVRVILAKIEKRKRITRHDWNSAWPFPCLLFDRQSQSLDFSQLMRQNDAGVKYIQITLF